MSKIIFKINYYLVNIIRNIMHCKTKNLSNEYLNGDKNNKA